MTAQKQRPTSLYLSAISLIALAACKQNTSALTATPDRTKTYKATARTMLVGTAFQACVAETPLQLSFKPIDTLPKTIVGNIKPTDAGFDYVEMVFAKNKDADALFADGQKLFMVGADGKRKACNLTLVYMARSDWKEVTTTPTKPDTSPDTAPTDEVNVTADSVKQASEIFALFNQKSAVKTSLEDSTTLTDAQKCDIEFNANKPAKKLHGVIQRNDRKEHFQVVLTSDIEGGHNALCKKTARVFVYARHLKNHPFALKSPGVVKFKKTADTTTDVCEFNGTLVAKMVDYSNVKDISYFKIELTNALPGVKQEKDFCKKGSVGFIEIAQFAQGAK